MPPYCVATIPSPSLYPPCSAQNSSQPPCSIQSPQCIITCNIPPYQCRTSLAANRCTPLPPRDRTCAENNANDILLMPDRITPNSCKGLVLYAKTFRSSSSSTSNGPTYTRCVVVRLPIHRTLFSLIPRLSTMDAQSQRPKGHSGALSTLNMVIEAPNLAKEISCIAPAQAVFGSVVVLLTIIRVSSLQSISVSR